MKYPPPQPRRSRLKTWLRRVGVFFAAAAALLNFYHWYMLRTPWPATEIYRGVVYKCFRLPKTSEGSGLVHIVQVDLTAPGVELFTTPVDPVAKAAGYEHTLQFPDSVLRRNGLAVVVNGTLFHAASGPIPWPGANALGETLVTNGVVSHVDPHAFLLWFDRDRTPHVCPTVPAPPDVLAQAQWGIGGGMVVEAGKPRPITWSTPNRRMILGINTPQRKLWIVAFENASFPAAANKLLELGATDAISLDGGASTTMVLGPDAAGVKPGDVIGGWRPVATHFGIKAMKKEKVEGGG